jgi:hypothetical protein
MVQAALRLQMHPSRPGEEWEDDGVDEDGVALPVDPQIWPNMSRMSSFSDSSSDDFIDCGCIDERRDERFTARGGWWKQISSLLACTFKMKDRRE